MNNIVDILIKFGVKKEAVQEAAAEIKKVEAATIQATTASVKGSQEASKETQKHTEHVGGLHKATGLLMRQFGEMGHLMHFAFNLPALAVAGLAIGINKLIESSHKLNEKTMERASEITAMWEARKEAEKHARDAAGEYADVVKKISENTETLATKEAAELKILRETLEARKKLLEAQEKAEIAAAGGDKVKEAEIRSRYGNKKTAEEIAAEKAQLDVESKNLLAAQKLAVEAKKKSEAAAADVKNFPANADADAARANVRITRGTEKAKDLEKELLDAQNASILRNANLGGHSADYLKDIVKERAAASQVTVETWMKNSQLGSAIERVIKATEERDKNRGEISEAQETVAIVENEKKRRAKVLEEANADWMTKDRDVQERNRAFQSNSAVFDIHRQNMTAVNTTENISRIIGLENERGNGANAKTIMNAAAGADAIAGGGRATREQAEAMNAVIKASNLQGQSSQAIIKLLSKMNNSQDEFLRSLKAIEDQHDRVLAYAKAGFRRQ